MIDQEAETPDADASAGDALAENTEDTPITEDGPQDLDQEPIEEDDVEVGTGD